MTFILTCGIKMGLFCCERENGKVRSRVSTRHMHTTHVFTRHAHTNGMASVTATNTTSKRDEQTVFMNRILRLDYVRTLLMQNADCWHGTRLRLQFTETNTITQLTWPLCVALGDGLGSLEINIRTQMCIYARRTYY